jgi:UDP-GlcNAc:undecaprenyl-phosphate/decaprenyl-phosphate GlcNAc-1-phosphate transferase
MPIALITGSIAFLITLVSIPVIMRVAVEKKMFDVPDERKLHTRPIASLGGVGIFIGFFLSILLSGSFKESPELNYFFAACLVIFFLGLKDDILVISARKKFLGQVLAAAIIIHLGNIRINSLHGLLGIQQIPEVVSLLLSYITVIVVINAYNLIDGIDGLAGSLGVFTTLIFGVYFSMAQMTGYALLSFALSGSLLAFLYYNFHPAKIFMGDSGSLMLGLVNAILVIKFIDVADTAHVKLPVSSAAAIGFSVLLLPLLDTLRVFSLRIAKGRSPFSPDRNHIHHLMLDRGMNHRTISLTCLGINMSFAVAAYLFRSLGPTILFGLLTSLGYCLVTALIFFVKPKTRLVYSRSIHQKQEGKSITADMSVTSLPKMVAIKTEVPAESSSL